MTAIPLDARAHSASPRRTAAGSIAKVVLAHLFLTAATLLTLFPVLLVVRKAFTPGQAFAADLGLHLRELTLEHFRDVLGAPYFLRQLLNSLAVAAATTVLGVILACTAAYAFARFRFPGRASGLLVFLVVQMFPATLLTIPIYVILDHMHLLNRLSGLVLVYATTAIPFCVWMLKGYFETIPRDIEEAARIDGASRLGVFLRVVLPLSRPALAVTALFSFMTAWNEFILAETFMSREESYTLPIALAQYVGQRTTEWGHFAAGALLVSLPVMALFYALQKHLVAGLTAGGVKG
jgi:arabinogalactan oligomer/maltooligosaccharide transport system permease protein